jgi:hypothetical protein
MYETYVDSMGFEHRRWVDDARGKPKMKIHYEPMLSLGFDITSYHARVWFLCWIVVWKVRDDQ